MQGESDAAPGGDPVCWLAGVCPQCGGLDAHRLDCVNTPAAAADDCTMLDFRRAAERATGRTMPTTPDLHEWSISDPGAFWSLVWDYFHVVGVPGANAYVSTTLPECVFFPEARVNLAENLLAPWIGSPEPAVQHVVERDGRLVVTDTVSGGELCRRVAAFADALRERGVVAGDRVGLILPVGPDALVCTLGALAVGAIVSSVAPEFGAASIVDRLGQLEPRVLVAALSYRWNGRDVHRAENIAEVVGHLPTLRDVLLTEPDDGVVEGAALDGCRVTLLREALDADVALAFERLPFDHPAYVLFSSGTTGKPKCLVHRAGGVLLKHLVELGLHANVRAGDRLLFYTTTSWMMWNWELSCLALGATLVLFDGAPAFPTPAALFDAARATGTTHLGLSARLLDHMRAQGVDIAARVGPPLREVLVTGSPLSVPTADWLAAQVGPGVMINPISGGTDLIGCFVGGDPTRPFHPGEMTGPILGMAVEVFTEDGVRAADGEPGELVCLQPFPTVPAGIWGDATGERLRSTYFDVWPGVWVHGDRAVRSERGGIAILGRSDATLNVGGVRIGTAEIYQGLADHPAVSESLAFGQEWDGDTRIVLLVIPSPGTVIDDHARASIRDAIRAACSPRHVPALIVAVPDLPRTQTGKLSEIAVREAVHGREVKGVDALANPASLNAIVVALGG